MTDQQIEEGFRQLAGALAPPADTIERVERRVRSRRRRRRATVVGGAALALVAVTGSAVALGGGDDGAELVATDPPAEPSGLTMTRPDGSTHVFDDVTVSCESPFGDRTKEPRIYAVSPRDIDGERLLTPFVYVEGLVSELQGEPELELPVDGPGDSESYPLVLFVADTAGARDGNEVSSATGDATGTVRVLEATCDPVPALRIEVDATLGSEEGKQSLDVAGSLRVP